MNRFFSLLALAFCGFLFSACKSPMPATSVEVPALFSDNMVLQRNAVNYVWGTATPDGLVKVTFKDQVAEVVADSAGKWRAYLAPESAGGPFELHVIGQDTLTFGNVLIGEVWLASGQSNMAWPLRSTDHAEADIAAANHPEIRLFTVKRTTAAAPQTVVPSDGWHETTPEHIASFSAVAYYFGRHIQENLDVPIGLIHSSWGGTVAEAWTSAKALKELPDFKAAVEEVEASAIANGNKLMSYEERVQAWLKAIEDNDAGYENNQAVWAGMDYNDSDWPTMTVPRLWEDDALPNYDGIVWFRKSIDLPASWQGQDLELNLAQIDDIDITWVNGTEVGQTGSYNQQRSYTIPADVVKPGQNVITVRVLDTGGGGGIWGEASKMNVAPASSPRAAKSLAGNWRYKPAIDLKEAPALPPRPAGEQNTPTMLYNAMIHPLIPYRIKGAIWYQGESNAGRAYQYRTLFPAMIQDWRNQWDSGIDFYFVQLANFMEIQNDPAEQETWPELREAQTMALALSNTGMAVTIDIGEADDIHPRNKRDVGYRLAQAALHTSYRNTEVVPSGPLYKSMTVLDGAVHISFDYTGSGLTTTDNAKLQGFAIAGEDRVFRWADAIIQDDKVIVSHPDIPNPVAVRYGWANNPIVNLYNEEGLPASPFRTDDWPGVTG